MVARSRLLPLLASILVMAGGPLSPSAGAAPAMKFTLSPGDAVFWSGPGSAPADCGTDCWSYKLDLPAAGYRLRIGIDRPLLGDVWDVEVEDPSGTVVGAFSPGTDLYSAELLDPTPDAGTYIVRVTAQDVVDRRFRMRASLEVDNHLPEGHVLVPPDLQPLPPWDFSFKMPITNGILGGESIGVGVPGGEPSCHPEEMEEYETVHCLRMSFGVGNVGLGPLELEVGPGNQFQDRPLIQHVRYSDQGQITRSAGNAYYHVSHLHYHHDRAVGLQLLRVVDSASGILQPAADPQLKGFAHRDELLRDWTSFYPRWNKSGFGLLSGWGDYYEWDRPGNFIDFGDNPNGLYVVRMVVNPEGFIMETDTTDNVAYSLIRVTGDQIEHLESGRGTDPWDPCRIPLPLGPEWENSFQLPGPRPAECPPI